LHLLPLCLQNLPAGASNLWVLLFHGGIAAMLGLYLLFWVKLNLAQTLPLALLLGVFTAGEGARA
jgi:oligosaccharyltransferase complex subunit delta (ribophorin II)